jgi:hypothetical protein
MRSREKREWDQRGAGKGNSPAAAMAGSSPGAADGALLLPGRRDREREREREEEEG